MSTAPDFSGRPDLSRFFARRALLAILLVALVVRVVGCFQGSLPFTYYLDEENNVQRALKFGAERTLRPDWFNKPTLGYYIWFAEYGIYYLAGKILGVFPEPEDFAVAYFDNPGPFYLIARISTAVFGTLGILAAYLLARRLSGRAAGLLAAVFLAVLPGQVHSSQEVKKDVVSAFFTTMSVVAMLDLVQRGRTKDYVRAGIFGGLGMATKYYAVALVVPYAFAHLFRSRAARTAAPRLALSGRFFGGVLAFFGAFFAGAPYCFLDREFFDTQVRPGFRFLMQRLKGPLLGQTIDVPHRGLVQKNNSIWDSIEYSGWSLFGKEGLGPALSVIVMLGLLAGMVALVRVLRSAGPERDSGQARRPLVVLVATLSGLLSIAVLNRQFPEPRHLNFLYPLLAVLGGAGIVETFRGCGALARRPGLPVLLGTLAVLVFAPGFPGPLLWVQTKARLRVDVRTRVLRWMEETLPAHASIINDKEWFALVPDTARCDQLLGRIATEKARWMERIEAIRRNPSSGTEEELRWLEDLVTRQNSYETLWRVRRKVAERTSRKVFDPIVFNHDWYSYELNRRHDDHFAYNTLWNHSPWGWLFDEVFRRSGSEAPSYTPEEARRRFLGLLAERIRLSLRAQLAGEGVSGPEVDRRLPILEAEARRNFVLRDDEVSLVELWRRRSPLTDPWIVSQPGKGTRVGDPAFDWFVSVGITFDNYEFDFRRKIFPDFAALYDDLKSHYDCLEWRSEAGDLHEVVRIWDLRTRKDSGVVTRMP